MLVTTLEQMENIVKNNKSLSWDGWSVISKYRSDKARTSKYGKLINGNWYITQKFVPERSGWNIPEKFINA